MCQPDDVKYYACKDFRYNPYLRYFYLLILLYCLFSAQQLSYGFSLIKKPSSVFQYYDGWSKLLADIYKAVPFVIEIRCILDFCFSYTALDIWQYFQLFKYNFELYAVCVSNSWYNTKPSGQPVEGCCGRLEGIVLLFVVFGALIVPFFLFSEAAPGLT